MDKTPIEDQLEKAIVENRKVNIRRTYQKEDEVVLFHPYGITSTKDPKSNDHGLKRIYGFTEKHFIAPERQGLLQWCYLENIQEVTLTDEAAHVPENWVHELEGNINIPQQIIHFKF